MDLLSVEHVISVHLILEKPSTTYRWIPEETRVKKRFFGRNKIVTIPGHYIGWYGDSYESNFEKNILDDPRFFFRKIDPEKESPSGTLMEKAYVKFTYICGKYTQENHSYFDSNDEAIKYVEEIEAKH